MRCFNNLNINFDNIAAESSRFSPITASRLTDSIEQHFRPRVASRIRRATGVKLQDRLARTRERVFTDDHDARYNVVGRLDGGRANRARYSVQIKQHVRVVRPDDFREFSTCTHVCTKRSYPRVSFKLPAMALGDVTLRESGALK